MVGCFFSFSSSSSLCLEGCLRWWLVLKSKRTSIVTAAAAAGSISSMFRCHLSIWFFTVAEGKKRCGRKRLFFALPKTFSHPLHFFLLQKEKEENASAADSAVSVRDECFSVCCFCCWCLWTAVVADDGEKKNKKTATKDDDGNNNNNNVLNERHRH